MPTKLIVMFLLGGLIFWSLPVGPVATIAPATPELTIRDIESGCAVYAGSAGNYASITLHGLYCFSHHDGCTYHAKYIDNSLRAVLVDCTDSAACAEWGIVEPVVPVGSVKVPLAIFLLIFFLRILANLLPR